MKTLKDLVLAILVLLPILFIGYMFGVELEKIGW